MKINKLVITIFFSAVGLFVSTALQAQESKTLFVNMPEDVYKRQIVDCLFSYLRVGLTFIM